MIRRGNNHNPSGDARGTWLLTFGDMITLMLTFFVLILSMSNIESLKVMGVAGSVKKILGIQEQKEGSPKGVIESVVPSLRDDDIERARAKNGEMTLSGAPADKREALSRALGNLVGEKGVPYRNGFIFSLDEGRVFLPGSVEISVPGRSKLKSIGAILKRSDVFVRVEGNTDGLPVAIRGYSSNWELSLALAVAVVKYLVSEGGIAPERLSAAGYADTRPRVPKDHPQSRQLNRRVDFFITFSEN